MIFIRLYNVYASIMFNGDNFYKILNIVKNIPGRVYLKKSWNVPLSSIKVFLSIISENGIDDIIVWNVKFVNAYRNWRNSTDKQMELKQLSNDTIIKGYNELIKTKEIMFPFQTIGSEFLRIGKRVLLSDTVGLGKTIQAFMAAERIMHDNKNYNTIIIVPATLKWKWKDDIVKFLGNSRNIYIIDGNKEIRKEFYKHINDPGVYIIVNYDLAIHDWSENLFPLLKERNGTETVLIFDEAQYLKNNKAKRHKFCKELSLYCKYIFGLSATFIETSLFDIFNSLLIINKSVFGDSVTAFQRRYVIFDFMGGIKGYKNIDEVTDLLAPILLRRRKDEINEQLPTIMETVYWCKLGKHQQKCYDDILNNVSVSFADKEKINKAELLAKLIYVQQACLSTELVEYDKSESTKLEMLIEIMEQYNNNEKIVIFTHFVKMTELIANKLKANGYDKIVTVTGSTKSQDRVDIVNKFNNTDEIRFLVSSDVFRFGLDLVGSSTLIHFDLLWNPANIQQRNGRIDRINQKNNMNILYFITKGTIEERMWSVLYQRGELFKDVIDSDYINKRSRQSELLYILKG